LTRLDARIDAEHFDNCGQVAIRTLRNRLQACLMSWETRFAPLYGD
jgi:hypothetical protein